MIKIFLTIKFVLLLVMTVNSDESIYIIDSNMTFQEAIKGTKAPDSVIKKLELLNIKYYSFDGKIHQGQLLVHRELVEEVLKLFDFMLIEKFPIAKMIPIAKYDWSDDKSMEDNNTSAFNYRFVAGTKRLSNHSFGRAIDINPFYNPVIYPDGRVVPKGARYEPEKPGRLSENSSVVKEFKRFGWRWGGNFTKYADNHHFDKN